MMCKEASLKAKGSVEEEEEKTAPKNKATGEAEKDRKMHDLIGYDYVIKSSSVL